MKSAARIAVIVICLLGQWGRSAPSWGAEARARLIVSNALGDTLEFEADTLRTLSPTNEFAIRDSSQAQILALEDGRALRIADTTTAGVYIRSDSLVLNVTGPEVYPRRVIAEYSRTYATFLRVSRLRSGCRVGVVFTPATSSGSPKQFVELMRSTTAGGYNSPRDDDRPTAYEYPDAWLERAILECSWTRTKPFVVTWFSFGEPGANPPRRSGWTVSGGRATYKPSAADLPRDWPYARHLKVASADQDVRRIGAVLVDPATRRITLLSP